MTEDGLLRIWKSVLAEIELSVSSGVFAAFFKATSLLSIEGRLATVGGEGAMKISAMQKRYLPLIEKLLSKHTGQAVKVVFVARDSSNINPSSVSAGPLFEERKAPARNLPRVRADYTFETLAVSGSNQLAVVSAQRVAKDPGKSYNPLFIYGPVGVGKTHLMQAIANAVFDHDPALKIIYITSEEFTNEVIEAIRNNDTGKMKKRFRSANLLIIDDVQFIAGKDKVQEELFHTFNILIDNASQIVLSSDKPPSEIKKLEARLSSRFAGGLTVDIEQPDFEMRCAIVMKKADKNGYKLQIEVAKIIAEKNQDVRSLEGALMRVITESATKQETLTTSFAASTLSAKGNDDFAAVHPDDVIKTACTFFTIKPTQLKGPKRDAKLVRARQITMYLLKTQLKMTLEDIGNVLGGRDHTTVMHGVEKMQLLMTTEARIVEEISGITRMLRG